MSLNALFAQLLLGLINGSFYAMLSLGLAIIFGLLGIVNVAQGAFYMLGAFVAASGTTASVVATGSATRRTSATRRPSR